MKSIDRVCLSENDDDSQGLQGRGIAEHGSREQERGVREAAPRLEYKWRLTSLGSCLTVQLENELLHMCV